MEQFSKELFWDCDPESIHLDSHRRFIIQRVLTRGRCSDWKALRSLYSWETLKKEALQVRELDPVTLAFCSAIFHAPKEEFRCFSKTP
jgi:hypothetical protein